MQQTYRNSVSDEKKMPMRNRPKHQRHRNSVNDDKKSANLCMYVFQGNQPSILKVELVYWFLANMVIRSVGWSVIEKLHNVHECMLREALLQDFI